MEVEHNIYNNYNNNNNNYYYYYYYYYFCFFSVLAVSFLILLQVKLAAQRSQKENLWGLLKHDVLHRECPSCCSAKSIQALTGLNNTTAVI